MDNDKRIPSVIRDISPCAECTEKFTACHDRCPKDLRGDFGYKAWKAKAQQVKDARNAYLDEKARDYEEQKRRKSWERTTFKRDFKL